MIGTLNDLALRGFSHVRPERLDSSKLVDQHLLQFAFDTELDEDTNGGRRWRSHSKCLLKDAVLTLQPHSTYVQSAANNPDHGGAKRRFRPIADAVLGSDTLDYLIRFTESIARPSVPRVFDQPVVTVGLHMVSYRPVAGLPAYSSPIWLHRDDEAFVAVILCGITVNLGGGENLISPTGASTITDVLRLTDRLEMLLLTQKCWHAVTPMHSVDGRPSRRDIVLVTFS